LNGSSVRAASGGPIVNLFETMRSLSSTAVLTRLFPARNTLCALYGLMPAPDGEGVV